MNLYKFQILRFYQITWQWKMSMCIKSNTIPIIFILTKITIFFTNLTAFNQYKISTLFILPQTYLIDNININNLFMIKSNVIFFDALNIEFHSWLNTNAGYWWSKTIIICSTGFNCFIRQSFRLTHWNMIAISIFLKQ